MLFIVSFLLISQGCSKKMNNLNEELPIQPTEPSVDNNDSLKIYKPKEFAGMDYNNKDSKWVK